MNHLKITQNLLRGYTRLNATSARLVSQNNITAAMGVELFSHVKSFLCLNKFAYTVFPT